MIEQLGTNIDKVISVCDREVDTMNTWRTKHEIINDLLCVQCKANVSKSMTISIDIL